MHIIEVIGETFFQCERNTWHQFCRLPLDRWDTQQSSGLQLDLVIPNHEPDKWS